MFSHSILTQLTTSIKFIIVFGFGFIAISPNSYAFQSKDSAQNERFLSEGYDCKALYDSAVKYHADEQYDQSSPLYQQALECAIAKADSEIISYSYYGLGGAARVKSDYSAALKYYLDAAQIYLEVPSLRNNLPYVHLELGIVNGKVDNLATAITFLGKATAAFKVNRDTSQIARCYNSLANVFERQKRYDSAKYYYEQSLALRINALEGERVAVVYTNLGMVEKELGELGQAEVLLLKAANIREQNNDTIGLAETYSELGDVYVRLNRLEEARQILQQAEGFALAKGIKKELNDIYKTLSNYYRLKEDYKQSVAYSEKYIEIYEELYSLGEQQANIGSIESFKTQEELSIVKEQRNLSLKSLELQENYNLILKVLVGLSLVLTFLAYNRYRIKKRANERIQTLMRELHHRVKNNLQIISDLLSLQSERLPDELARKAVKAGEDRVRAMALIHKDLYHEEGLKDVNMHDYLEKLTLNLVASYGYDNKKVKLDLAIDNIQIDVDKAIPIGLIANELISNSFKYAFPDHPAPVLSISFSRTFQDELELTVSDNGIGLGPNTSVKDMTSFGLKLVHMLTKQLKGKLVVQNEEGLKYSLKFPA